VSPLKLVAFFSAALLLTGAAQATTITYDATTDFSVASNPNGVWTYGYLNVAGGSFTNYASSTTSWHGNGNLDAWSQFTYDSGSYSVVGKNVSGSIQFESVGGSISIDPGTLFLHPGNSGEMATIRFTAPSNGLVDISALFHATDTLGGNRDVHVYENGVSLLSAFVLGSKTAPSGNVASYTSPLLYLPAGTKIDFAVGYGSDGVYYNDATRLAASVSFKAVPEPASLMLFGLGATGLFFVVRRRRKV
jgi:hypothetical protein